MGELGPETFSPEVPLKSVTSLDLSNLQMRLENASSSWPPGVLFFLKEDENGCGGGRHLEWHTAVPSQPPPDPLRLASFWVGSRLFPRWGFVF